MHCLLTGVAFGLLAVTGLGFLESPIMDAVLIVVAVLVGAVAVWHGIRVHRSLVPVLVFVSGLAMILVGHFGFGHDHEAPSTVGTALSVFGGLSIVTFHLVNWKLQRDRQCCHNAHCEHSSSPSHQDHRATG